MDSQKIKQCCEIAKYRDGLSWVWVDTCNIDKGSSSELSEAINSMFRYYAEAKICYAYLSDVDSSTFFADKDRENLASQLKTSRWFTRGWTLQELIAPKDVLFCSAWKEIGNRHSWKAEISQITHIHEVALQGGSSGIKQFSIAQKMSWAADRKTTRAEDTAYCLLGLFGVQMPLLYGEGDRAFIRLQEIIINEYDDQSIIAWEVRLNSGEDHLTSLLAVSPDSFQGSNMVPFRLWKSREPYAMTNAGLQLTGLLGSGSPYRRTEASRILCLSVYSLDHPEMIIGVQLMQLAAGGDQYARSNAMLFKSRDPRIKHPSQWEPKKIYVRKTIALPSLHEQEETGKLMSYVLSANLEDPARTSLHIRYVHPESQWINLHGQHGITPPVFEQHIENIDNWSWQVAVVLSLIVDWGQDLLVVQSKVRTITISESAGCVLFLGYNGRYDRCWCALQAIEGTLIASVLAARSWHEYAGSTTKSTSSIELHQRITKDDNDTMDRSLILDVSLHMDDGLPIFGAITPRWDKSPVRLSMRTRFRAVPRDTSKVQTPKPAPSPGRLIVNVTQENELDDGDAHSSIASAPID